MTNLKIPTILFLFLLFNYQAFGQGNGANNQATIIDFSNIEDTTLVANLIDTLLRDNNASHPPSVSHLTNFLASAFNSLNMQISNSNCLDAGLRVYADTIGTDTFPTVSFRYDNLSYNGGPMDKMLFVGILNYAHDDVANPNYMYFSHHQFGGSDVLLDEDRNNPIRCTVILTGVLCNDCQGNISSCISQMGIIVIDKNIL